MVTSAILARPLPNCLTIKASLRSRASDARVAGLVSAVLDKPRGGFHYLVVRKGNLQPNGEAPTWAFMKSGTG